MNLIIRKRFDTIEALLIENPDAPHHIHFEDGKVQQSGKVPDAFSVIKQIEAALK